MLASNAHARRIPTIGERKIYRDSYIIRGFFPTFFVFGEKEKPCIFLLVLLKALFLPSLPTFCDCSFRRPPSDCLECQAISCADGRRYYVRLRCDDEVEPPASALGGGAADRMSGFAGSMAKRWTLLSCSYSNPETAIGNSPFHPVYSLL